MNFSSRLMKTFVQDTGFNFATYMIYALPESFICLIFAWVVVCAIQLPLPFLNRRPKLETSLELQRANRIKSRIDSRYNQLGPVASEEMIVLVTFVVLAFLWIFKSPQILPGSVMFSFFRNQSSPRWDIERFIL